MTALDVLLPVHNGSSTVGRAIRSTLRALRPTDRLYVIDDGSTDMTREVVESISDTRLTLLANARPMGVAQALNLALAAGSSGLVARMDADDIALPWRFEYTRSSLGALDGAFTTVAHFGAGLRSWRVSQPSSLRGTAFDLVLLLENPFTHPTFIGRRAVLENLGGYGCLIAEDYDLWLRMRVAGYGLARLSIPSLLYRHSGTQVTATQGWRTTALSEAGWQQSYRQFTRRVLNADPYWLDDLIARPGSSSPALVGMERLVRSRTANLRRSDRLAVERRLRHYVGSPSALRD